MRVPSARPDSAEDGLVRFYRLGGAAPRRRIFGFAPAETDVRLFRQMVRNGLDAELFCYLPLPVHRVDVETLDAYASYYVPHLRTLADGEPCYLAGFSAMGICATECANQLVAAGVPVAGVMLLDSPHPCQFPRARLGDLIGEVIHEFRNRPSVRSAVADIERRLGEGTLPTAAAVREVLPLMQEAFVADLPEATDPQGVQRLMTAFADWAYGALVTQTAGDIRSSTPLWAAVSDRTFGSPERFAVWSPRWRASAANGFRYRSFPPVAEDNPHHGLLLDPEVARYVGSMLDARYARSAPDR